jgi:hypothetical protein
MKATTFELPLFTLGSGEKLVHLIGLFQLFIAAASLANAPFLGTQPTPQHITTSIDLSYGAKPFQSIIIQVDKQISRRQSSSCRSQSTSKLQCINKKDNGKDKQNLLQ